MSLPLAYQLSIFGTPLGAKFQLDRSRAMDGRILTGKAMPAPHDRRFVVASGARSLPGQYLRHNPGLGAYYWRGLGALGQDPAAAGAVAAVCQQNCSQQFAASGRAAKCYNICVSGECSKCDRMSTGGFGTAGRQAKCRAACQMSKTGAVIPEEGMLPPGVGPGGPGIGSALLPVLGIGAAVLGLIYIVKKRKKKAAA